MEPPFPLQGERRRLTRERGHLAGPDALRPAVRSARAGWSKPEPLLERFGLPPPGSYPDKYESEQHPILYVGLDVAKASLQLDLAGKSRVLANDAKGHARLLKLLRAHPAAQVVCEATSGYEQPVVRALHAAQVPASVVEAGRVRHFARAKGQRAKTDAIDAPVLSEYGRAFQPAPTPVPTAQQTRLAELSQRRGQLLRTRNRAAHYLDQLCVR